MRSDLAELIAAFEDVCAEVTIAHQRKLAVKKSIAESLAVSEHKLPYNDDALIGLLLQRLGEAHRKAVEVPDAE